MYIAVSERENESAHHISTGISLYWLGISLYWLGIVSIVE